jgi:hypothetical protein
LNYSLLCERKEVNNVEKVNFSSTNSERSLYQCEEKIIHYNAVKGLPRKRQQNFAIDFSPNNSLEAFAMPAYYDQKSNVRPVRISWLFYGF